MVMAAEDLLSPGWYKALLKAKLPVQFCASAVTAPSEVILRGL